MGLTPCLCGPDNSSFLYYSTLIPVMSSISMGVAPLLEGSYLDEGHSTLRPNQRAAYYSARLHFS